MDHSSNQGSRSAFFRKMMIILSFAIVPLMFDRLDRTYFVPQQLSKLIDVMDVATEISDDWWRARIRLRHNGFYDVDVALNLTWFDSEGNEVGKSQSIRSVTPGDTVIVRLSTKAIGGRKAVSHLLDYSVSSIP